MKPICHYCLALFHLTVLAAAFLSPLTAAAQFAGKYRSAPNSLALYMYQGDGIESVPVPADITVQFSGGDPASTLTAVIHKPIIGDRATGPDETIVEEFPMVVIGTSTDGMTFSGNLPQQYGFDDWTFELAANGNLNWSGEVGWWGGRYEQTIIDNVRLVPLTPGDYSENGTVDAADYAVWRKLAGNTGIGLAADGDADNDVDNVDYLIWRANIGQTTSRGSLVNAAVPEPAAWLLVVAAMPAILRRRARK